jgi:CP family cyanate transporter-like MFS transporter
MNQSAPITLSPRAIAWFGVAGVLILALGGRTGVAALSPIAGEVELEVPIDGLWLAMIGAIPPVAYAISGLFSPWFARKLSLEGAAVFVSVVTAAAHLGRGLTPNYFGLFASTVVLMLAIGVLNVILPGLVKLYAPTRIGLITSLYSTMMAISTAAPSAIGFALAREYGWRISIASWSIISIAAVIPFLLLLPVAMKRRQSENAVYAALPAQSRSARVGRSATARSIMLIFAVSGFTAYTTFGVLPQILRDHVGSSPEQAALALTVFAILGMPMSLVIPNLAVRSGWSGRLILLSATSGLVGWVGLLFIPAIPPVFWAVLTGLNTLTFSMSLALIGARTQTHQMATELSGFVNTVGYLVAGFGPIVVGALHEITGSWVTSLVVLMIFSICVLPAYFVLSKERTIEEELEAKGVPTGPIALDAPSR